MQHCLSLHTAEEVAMAHYQSRMATAFMPATLGRSDDLPSFSWSCLSLRTQDGAAGSLRIHDVDMVLLVSLTRPGAFSRAI